jgi:hypothetical protein
MASSATENNLQCQIFFNISTEASEEADDQRRAILETLARLVNCSLESIKIVGTQDPPNVLTLALPEYAFERLLTAGQSGDAVFEELGIAQIKEVVSQPHNFANIRRMLDKMFTPDEFRQFCQKHFPAVDEQIAAEVKKLAMIDALLDYARKTKRIPHILVFAQKHNAAVYKRGEPYFYVPRTFSYQYQKAARRRAPRPTLGPAFFNLQKGEFVKSAAAGIGVAAVLMFLLQRVLMMPIEDQNAAQVLQLLWGTTAFIAIVVARVASWGANHKHGKLLAIISVASYWLGMMLGNALAYLSSMGIGFQPGLAGSALVFGFYMTISPLFSFGAPLIVLIIGTYFAYRYAR